MKAIVGFFSYIFWFGFKAGWCLQRHVRHWAIIPMSKNSRKTICPICGTRWAMHDGLKTIFPLDEETEHELDETKIITDKYL
jgi:hypothetical protein